MPPQHLLIASLYLSDLVLPGQWPGRYGLMGILLSGLLSFLPCEHFLFLLTQRRQLCIVPSIC